LASNLPGYQNIIGSYMGAQRDLSKQNA
ncbi:TPA: hydrolase, partial [Bacillus anthracis]|nr:hydrolase [Bacillus anthracis]